MDAEMLRNVLTMLGTVLGAILVLMLVAKITSMVHVEADVSIHTTGAVAPAGTFLLL